MKNNRMWICRLLHTSFSSAKLAAVAIEKVINRLDFHHKIVFEIFSTE
jgi:hypothetical protein